LLRNQLSLNILPNIFQGITAFTATNLDDIVVLMVFFAQVNAKFRPWQIVAGQYLGFGVLILLSLPGYFGGQLLPAHWIGLLGLVPLGIGIKMLLMPNEEAENAVQVLESDSSNRLQRLLAFMPPQILQVGAITVANGGDNLGVYIPLFASKNLVGLLTILATFGVLVGIWCYIAKRLVQQPTISRVLGAYGDRLIPWVLMALGLYILFESSSVAYLLQSVFNL
jgi:cadmium resistance transport/sequestration family protein